MSLTRITWPRLLENCLFSIVMNSELTTSVGRLRTPYSPGSPPLSPLPL